MAQTLSFTPLALDLPNSRMSVDFSTFTSSYHKSQTVISGRPQGALPSLPQQVSRKPAVRPAPLTNVQEEPESVQTFSKPRISAWDIRQPTIRIDTNVPNRSVSRNNSSASTNSSASLASLASTVISPVFSYSNETARTSLSSLEYNKAQKSTTKRNLNLSSLPLSLLEHILSYALCLPLTVSIGPQNSENRHMQYRYHRAGLDYIDIQLIRKHPIFLVSHHIRDVALNVFHDKCDFVVDFSRIYHTRVSSTVNDNLKANEKFWVNQDPPKMVLDTLCSLSRLNLRLPVPSRDNGAHRGRDEQDWMDGSDGKGGGNWKIRSLKREQEDAARIQSCVDIVRQFVMMDPSTRPESRGRKGSLSRSGSLRRSLSRARSKSRGRRPEDRSASRQSNNSIDNNRRLKRLEVTLVKRSSHVMVLPETIGLIKVLRSIPVAGFTKYFFELEEQQVLWATKHRKKWKGFEPDGPRLLQDLQGLTIADKPIEPILTPKEFQYVSVGQGRLQLSDAAMPKTPIVLERPEREKESLSPMAKNPTSRRMGGLNWVRKNLPRPKNSNDSFGALIDEGKDTMGSSGTNTSGRNNPPSVEELKKIAEDIKNGLY